LHVTKSHQPTVLRSVAGQALPLRGVEKSLLTERPQYAVRTSRVLCPGPKLGRGIIGALPRRANTGWKAARARELRTASDRDVFSVGSGTLPAPAGLNLPSKASFVHAPLAKTASPSEPTIHRAFGRHLA
jgi:hypothetical protein